MDGSTERAGWMPGMAAPGRPAGGAWPQPLPAARYATDTLLRMLLCVYVATLVVEGPLRWGVALSGWPNLLYARDAIPAGTVAYLLLRTLVSQRWLDLPVLAAAAVLAMHALIGLVQGLAPFQVALGVKTFMYLVYGMAMWPLLQDRWPQVLRAGVVVYVVTLAGLAINYAFGTMPWEGVQYSTAFGTVGTTWQWWMGDMPRLPGFARVSFNAAMLLGLSGLLTMVWVRRPWVRALVAALALLGILGTTSKGMLLAFPVAATWLVFRSGPLHAQAGRLLVYGLCGLGLALPAVVVLADLGSGLQPEDWPDVVQSAWERFNTVWPGAFEQLPSGVVGLLGGGLGSIGTPQMFGLYPDRFNPADSLAVYLIVCFGVAGVLYYVLPALMLDAAGRVLHDDHQRVLVALLVIAYGYGISISMVEEAFFLTTLGIALGCAISALRNRPPVP